MDSKRNRTDCLAQVVPYSPCQRLGGRLAGYVGSRRVVHSPDVSMVVLRAGCHADSAQPELPADQPLSCCPLQIRSTSSRSSLPGLKKGILFGGTSTRAPVFGLRPMRARLGRVWKLPNPRISTLSPARRARTMLSNIARTTTSDSFRDSSVAWQISSVRSALVIWNTLVHHEKEYHGVPCCPDAGSVRIVGPRKEAVRALPGSCHAAAWHGLLLLLLKRAHESLRAPLLDPLQPLIDLLQLVTEVGAHLRDQRGSDVFAVDGRKHLVLSQHELLQERHFQAGGIGLHLGLKRCPRGR